jgi:hypothetical protein
MPMLQITDSPLIRDAEQRAGEATHKAGVEAAAQRFDRVSSELAGDDATLKRVLLARLHDAWREGYKLAHDEEHARFEARFDLPAPQQVLRQRG